jgi:cytosine/adenosine deaminase-related metal-dependent hydrolase
MERREKNWKVLKARRLIDGKGGEVPEDACVVIEGPRIHAVGAAKDLRFPRGAEEIALPDCTLMPGLLDIHLHTSAYNILTFQNPGWPTSKPPRSSRCSMRSCTPRCVSSRDSPL